MRLLWLHAQGMSGKASLFVEHAVLRKFKTSEARPFLCAFSIG